MDTEDIRIRTKEAFDRFEVYLIDGIEDKATCLDMLAKEIAGLRETYMEEASEEKEEKGM